jgi:membrane-associated phospholipid phosphatase
MPADLPESTRKFYPVDWLLMAYALFMAAMLAILGRPFADYIDGFMIYLAVAAGVALIVYFFDGSAGGWRAFMRYIYPAFFFGALYQATGGHMFLLFDKFFDFQVVAFERNLFGINPTLYFDQHLLNVWTTEVLSFCYFCYYFMIPVFLYKAFVRRRFRLITQFLAAASVAFIISYLLFWLYPIEGPRWHLAAAYLNSIEGPVFRSIVDYVIDNAAVRGGAMPSSHTGVAVVTLIFSLRYFRRFGQLLIPIVTGLSLGAVWGRFHYVTDIVAGALIGIFAVWLVWKYIDHPVAAEENRNEAGKLRTEHAT